METNGEVSSSRKSLRSVQRSEGLPTDKALQQRLDRNGTSANDRDIAEFCDNFAREFPCADARGP